MTEDERNSELLRLNEESRQNVFRLHRGEISDAEFEVLMKAIQVEIRLVVHAGLTTGAGNGKEG